MNTAETIKNTREALGMTQEDLAEKLEVSRQAVSKWEVGASAPSPENLAVLEEVLGVAFPTEGEETIQEKPRLPLWKIALIALGVLMAAALFSIVLYLTVKWDRAESESIGLTGVYWFTEDGKPLHPDSGDGWSKFEADTRVLLVAVFQDYPEREVQAVSIYLTPTGTETFDQREQLAVQAMADGQKFALFSLDIPKDLMGHLEIKLECGEASFTEMLNIISES